MLLRKLIVFAITSGLAKKAWDQVRKDPGRQRLPVDITDVVARPLASADPARRRALAERIGARRRRQGPSA